MSESWTMMLKKTIGPQTSPRDFQVLARGPMSAGFTKALKALQARGFADRSCAIVKTTLGEQSGITHEGGRYVHAKNPYAPKVIAAMKASGMTVPTMPFILAPGPKILFHEWGHHVDNTWSQADIDVPFSFRWFSHVYQIRYHPLSGLGLGSVAPGEDIPIEIEDHAARVVPQWRMLASELFADLFDDWMRNDKKVAWDACEPKDLDHRGSDNACLVRLDLLPSITVGEIRRRIYALFEQGLQHPAALPEVRKGFFGPYTAATLGRLRAAMERIRSETRSK